MSGRPKTTSILVGLAVFSALTWGGYLFFNYAFGAKITGIMAYLDQRKEELCTHYLNVGSYPQSLSLENKGLESLQYELVDSHNYKLTASYKLLLFEPVLFQADKTGVYYKMNQEDWDLWFQPDKRCVNSEPPASNQSQD
jgi:hypothetical protein